MQMVKVVIPLRQSMYMQKNSAVIYEAPLNDFSQLVVCTSVMQVYPLVLIMVMVPLPSVWILVQATTDFPERPEPSWARGLSLMGIVPCTGLGGKLSSRLLMSLRVTAPSALYGFKSAKGYVTGVCDLSLNLLGPVDGFWPAIIIIKQQSSAIDLTGEDLSSMSSYTEQKIGISFSCLHPCHLIHESVVWGEHYQKWVAWKRVSQDPATCQLLVDAVAVVAKVVGNLLQEYYTIQSIFVTFPVTKSWRTFYKIGLEIT